MSWNRERSTTTWEPIPGSGEARRPNWGGASRANCGVPWEESAATAVLPHSGSLVYSPSSVSESATPLTSLIGEGGGRIGPYRLIERLGRGRQADVWRALRTEPTFEEVALKVLPASARDPRRLAQLRREAERGARLSGPSLLPTYEFGEADGIVFMAMPLVVGCTLAAIIAQRRQLLRGTSPPEMHQMAGLHHEEYRRAILRLMARVARAAAEAHAAHVVHRDIKPGNILVRDDHEAGVYLCDFGLARDTDVATPSQLRDGAGSPLYMAPERLLKLPANEIRCDVYALGVTLFEAVLLVPPVEVPPEMPRSLWASHLATTQPRRPSDYWPGIPRGLESVILRASARNPNRRYPDAGLLADDLERLLVPRSSARRVFW